MLRLTAPLSICSLIFSSVVPISASAVYFGAEAPLFCAAERPGCGDSLSAPSSVAELCLSSLCLSRTEGTLRERLPIAQIHGSNGPTLNLALSYASYNADTSRARFDTVLGIGWTHSYNEFLYTVRGHLFRVDGDGRITKFQLTGVNAYQAAAGYFERLVKNSDGSYSITKKDGTVARFAAVPGTRFLSGMQIWRLASSVDRNGNKIALTYDQGNLVSIADPYGRKLTLTYGPQGQLASVTDPASRTTQFLYDSTFTRLSSVTMSGGRVTRYTYNSGWQLIDKAQPDGTLYRVAYGNNKPIGVTAGSAGNGRALSNSLAWATDPEALARDLSLRYLPGKTTEGGAGQPDVTYEYDVNGYVTKVLRAGVQPEIFAYDPATLQTTAYTDTAGRVTRFEYDSAGDLVRVVDPAGRVTRYSYDPMLHKLTEQIDPEGRKTSYLYDARGNLLQQTQPSGSVQQWTYDSRGNVLTETNPTGFTKTHTYDQWGNRVKTTDSAGNITTITYNAAGEELSRNVGTPPAPPPATSQPFQVAGVGYKTLAEALAVLKDGDTLLVRPGHYLGQAGIVRANNVTIKTNGGEAIFENGSVGGKATFVVQGRDTTWENIATVGVKVPDRNGAGWRIEAGGRHRFVNVRMEACENGILTNNNLTDADIELINAVVRRNGNTAGSAHGIYIGTVRSLRVQGGIFEDVLTGHLIKSRAAHTLIEGVTLREGRASRAVDVPNGGVVEIRGSDILQTQETANSNIIGYALEPNQTKWTKNEFYFRADNKVLDLRKPTGPVFMFGIEPAVKVVEAYRPGTPPPAPPEGEAEEVLFDPPAPGKEDSWWNSLPVNTVIRVRGTRMTDHSTVLVPSWYKECGDAPWYAFLANFSGGAIDEQRGRMLFFGGGFVRGTRYNGVVEMQMDNFQYRLVSPPSRPEVNCSIGSYPGWPNVPWPLPDGKTPAHHSYGGIVYEPRTDELITFRSQLSRLKLSTAEWHGFRRLDPYGLDTGLQSLYDSGTQRIYLLSMPTSRDKYALMHALIEFDAVTGSYHAIAFERTTGVDPNRPTTVRPVGVTSLNNALVKRDRELWYFTSPYDGFVLNLDQRSADGKTFVDMKKISVIGDTFQDWGEGTGAVYVPTSDRIYRLDTAGGKMDWYAFDPRPVNCIGPVCEFRQSKLALAGRVIAPARTKIYNRMHWYAKRQAIVTVVDATRDVYVIKVR